MTFLEFFYLVAFLLFKRKKKTNIPFSDFRCFSCILNFCGSYFSGFEVGSID